jgi:cobalamin synthase
MRNHPGMDGERRRTIIGIAAIMLVALALVALPRGGDVINVVSAALQAVFLAVIALSGQRLYQARSGWLAELPDRDRGVLYGALAVALLTLVAKGRFDALGGGGSLIWLSVLVACGLAVYWVWRESRRFSY